MPLYNPIDGSDYTPLPSGTPAVGQIPTVTDDDPLTLGWGEGGGLPSTFVAASTTHTAANGEYVLADATTAGFAVDLPADPAVGAVVIVQKVDASGNAITVTPAGGGTIDGDADASIVSASTWIFEHQGSNVWHVAAGTGSAGPVLDTNSSNITSTVAGSPAAGTVGKAADSGHQHAIGEHTHADATNGGPIDVAGIDATGTPSAGTFLRGDGAWAAPSTSYPVLVPQSGDWFTCPWATGNATGSVFLDQMVFMPIWVAEAMTVNAIAITINTAAASAVMRLGIWSPHATTALPDARVLDAGTADASTTGVKTISISQSLTPGLLWLSAVPQVVLSQWRRFGTTTIGPAAAIGASNLVIQVPGSNIYRQNGVSGALPSNATPVFAGNSDAPPIIGLVRA